MSGKISTPDFEFVLAPIDLGDGPMLVNVLGVNKEREIDRAREGDALAVGNVLASINNALASGTPLTSCQASYLADGLAAVLGDLQRFGRPFGVVPKRGRPTGTGKVSGWKQIRLGRLVDKLHHPERYGLTIAATPIEDNAVGAGAYTLVAEATGVSVSIVKRAYTTFLRTFGRRSA